MVVYLKGAIRVKTRCVLTDSCSITECSHYGLHEYTLGCDSDCGNRGRPKDGVGVCQKELTKAEEAPPLGIIPRKLWQEQRMVELSNSIQRYLIANKYSDCLLEWIDELGDMVRERAKHESHS